jgi:hypothetical protein
MERMKTEKVLCLQTQTENSDHIQYMLGASGEGGGGAVCGT